MPHKTNIDEYNKFTREQLIKLLGIYGRLALTLDGLWFLAVENSHGIDTAIRHDEAVWRQYGRSEARVLKKFLGIDKVTNLDEVAQIYLLTPVFGNLGGVGDTQPDKCILSVTDCHPQKARIKKNMGEFPCKSVGIAYFEGLLSEMNEELSFTCKVCPPDQHKDDLWCEWDVRFNEKHPHGPPNQAL